MKKRIDLPDLIPVFPLPRALLLPRARLPLHIFEPRYLTMVEDTLKTSHRLIGMVQPRNQNGQDTLSAIGCAGRITQFSETEDGRYMITLTGTSRFRLGDEQTGFHPYRRYGVDWVGFDQDLGSPETDDSLDRAVLFNTLSRFLSCKGMATDWEALRDADDELLINALSMMLEFEVEEKQALLEAPCLATRREILITLLEFNLHTGTSGEKLQ